MLTQDIMHNFKLKPGKYVEISDEPFPLVKRNSTTKSNGFRFRSKIWLQVFFQVFVDVSIQGNRQCPVHIKSLKSNFPLGSSTSVIAYWSRVSFTRFQCAQVTVKPTVQYLSGTIFIILFRCIFETQSFNVKSPATDHYRLIWQKFKAVWLC